MSCGGTGRIATASRPAPTRGRSPPSRRELWPTSTRVRPDLALAHLPARDGLRAVEAGPGERARHRPHRRGGGGSEQRPRPRGRGSPRRPPSRPATPGRDRPPRRRAPCSPDAAVLTAVQPAFRDARALHRRERHGPAGVRARGPPRAGRLLRPSRRVARTCGRHHPRRDRRPRSARAGPAARGPRVRTAPGRVPGSADRDRSGPDPRRRLLRRRRVPDCRRARRR